MDLSLLLAMVVVVAAGVVSGLAAFGFALVAVPPLLLLYDPPTVTALSILLVMITRWAVLIETWRHIEWRPVALTLPTALAGTVVGTLMVRELDAGYIELVAGVVVVGSAVVLLAGWAIPGANSPAAAPFAGLISGALSSSTGMAGPPLVLLFAARKYPPQVFRGSMTVIFYVLGASSLYLLAREDLIGRSELGTVAKLLPAAVLGTVIGQRALRRMSAHQFNRIVLMLLLVTGMLGVVAAVRHLVA